MKVTLLVAVLWIFLSGHTARSEEKAGEKKPANVKIKIVDSPASRISPFQSAGSKELKLRVKPANLSGPSHLQQLAGECFMLREKGYEYQVCPFHNVTQKEERISWNSFHGVLGVWREWLIENDTFVGMHFVMGQQCSIGDREVEVLFNCSTVTRLHSTSEPSTCHYIIWLDTPLACFKGAMQVYHLLTSDQLKQWEQYEYEYHADELTFQGLTKRRRKILTEAGLLFDHKKEKARLEEEKRQREEEAERERERREKELADNPLFKSPLTACEQERDQLKKELDELTGKIRAVIKDFPAVAYRLGFLQNSTSSQKKEDRETPVPLENEREEIVAVDDDLVGVEEVAAVMVDGGEREGEREREREREGEREGEKFEEQNEWSRGGFLDHNEVDENQLDNILEEINEEVEERDRMELKWELSELQKPDGGPPENQQAVGERGEEERKEIDSDEQLVELIEQLKHAQKQQTA